jgi:hypothetical protein
MKPNIRSGFEIMGCGILLSLSACFFPPLPISKTPRSESNTFPWPGNKIVPRPRLCYLSRP